jgi:uncharacterized protein YcbK (DUF882 family)
VGDAGGAGEDGGINLVVPRNDRQVALPRTALKRFRLPLAAVLLCFSAAVAQLASAASERTITFYNLHTYETTTITYKRDGRYLPEGMAQINYALRDWRLGAVTEMNPRLIDLVWEIYQQSGSTEPIKIISAYRAPQTNEMLRSQSNGVAENSQHMLGNAMDIQIPDVDLTTLRNIALRMQIGGVGFYPGSGSPFVHVDVGSVRHWPRLSRTELAGVFPDGHTLHIPSDGTPLPGYAEAQLAYQDRGDQVVPLFGTASEDAQATRLAGLFGRDRDTRPAAAAAQPAALPAAAADPVMLAFAEPTLIIAPPAARPTIPGVTIEPPPNAMAFAPAAAEPGRDPLAMILGEARPAAAIPAPPPEEVDLALEQHWYDPLAVITRPSISGSDLPFRQITATVRQEAFARLTAPNIGGSPHLLALPDRVAAGGFLDPPAIDTGYRFAGAVIVPVPMIDLTEPTRLAQAR